MDQSTASPEFGNFNRRQPGVLIVADHQGFRSRKIVIATTLWDPKAYPKEAIAELGRLRWAGELFLRDIKITLGMDVLKCTPPK